jgi:hypothetical protein
MTPHEMAERYHPDYCLHAEDWGAVKTQLGGIEHTLGLILAQTSQIGDRVRLLEDYRNRQVGAMALIGGACGLIGALLVKLAFWAMTKGGSGT